MGAVGRVGHEPAAVERGAGADAVGERRCGAHGHGAAHAISRRPHLAVAGHRVPAVQIADESACVRHSPLRGQRAHQGEDLLARRFVPERGALRQDRRLLGAVVGIDDQHRVARFGQPPPHLLEGGPETEGIGPDQHARMGAARRVHEVAVRRAVGRRYLDIRSRHLQGVRSPRQEHGQSRPDRKRPELAPGQPSRTAQIVLRVTQCSLVAHGCLPSRYGSHCSPAPSRSGADRAAGGGASSRARSSTQRSSAKTCASSMPRRLSSPASFLR